MSWLYVSKKSGVIVDLADAITKQGISIFRFDFSGNGESEGEFQYGNYRKEAHDLHSVVSYLNQDKYDVMAIVGHSKAGHVAGNERKRRLDTGIELLLLDPRCLDNPHAVHVIPCTEKTELSPERGDVVVLYASMYDDVHMVVNLSGRFYLEKGIEERLGKEFIDRINKEGYIDVTGKPGKVLYRVTKDSLMERLNTDMRAASLSIIKECSFLTDHGSDDELVPVEDAYEFARKYLVLQLYGCYKLPGRSGPSTDVQRTGSKLNVQTCSDHGTFAKKTLSCFILWHIIHSIFSLSAFFPQIASRIRSWSS